MEFGKEVADSLRCITEGTVTDRQAIAFRQPFEGAVDRSHFVAHVEEFEL